MNTIRGTTYATQYGAPEPTSAENAILLVYTGGTIGAVPSDRLDPASPLRIANWKDFEEGVKEIDLLRRRGIRIDTVSLDKPLDSTEVEPEHWRMFVDIIAYYYDLYMGFVILHGTDTMVFTASALSFMLSGLDKPVIITGSQVPIIDHPNTDGTRNLVNAINVAAWKVTGIPKVGEVCIAFDKVLLRGNRARKASADLLAGFSSPNFPPLGALEDRVTINTELLWPTRTAFNPERVLNPNVISLQIFPGIQSSNVLAQFFASPDLKGVVLQAYGTGNAPTAPRFLDSIEEGVKDGKVILDVTQCFSGSVRLGQYETGVGLLQRGVLSGSDLTPEAALCKLMVLLGREELSADVHRYLQRSLAGEQSESVYTSAFLPPAEGQRWELTGADARVDLTRSLPGMGWDPAKVSSAWLHLHDGRIQGTASVRFEVYFQLDPDVPPTPRHRGFAADVKKSPFSEPSFISFDVGRGSAALPPDRPPRVSIVLRSDGSVSFASATLIVVTNERTQVR